MKKHALSWLLPKPFASGGYVDPVIHQIGHAAVAEALATSDTLEKHRQDLLVSGAPVNETIGPGRIFAVPDTNSPEYHLGLSERMITTLQERIERAKTKRADQRQTFELDREERAAKQEASDMAQAAEIAGLVKSLAAYTAARDVLAVPPPASPAPVDPARLTAVGVRIAETKRTAARDVQVSDSPVNKVKRMRARSGRRETFDVPPGHEAVRDAEGRATGETRLIARVDQGAIDIG